LEQFSDVDVLDGRLGLLQNGYRARLISNRTAEDFATGKMMSSQFMFNDSQQAERDLGLNFWEKECPYTDGPGVTIAGPDGGRRMPWRRSVFRAFSERATFYGTGPDEYSSIPCQNRAWRWSSQPLLLGQWSRAVARPGAAPTRKREPERQN
jgi:hypothetical protein